MNADHLNWAKSLTFNATPEGANIYGDMREHFKSNSECIIHFSFLYKNTIMHDEWTLLSKDTIETVTDKLSYLTKSIKRKMNEFDWDQF